MSTYPVVKQPQRIKAIFREFPPKPAPPDLDCGEISERRFRVTGNDPHGFDGDNDGIGCES